MLTGADSGERGPALEALFVRIRWQRMGLQPQRAGSDGRIDTGLFPPRGFIATAMDLTVVAPAQRHGELIAHFSPERAVLREPQMMGIGGPAAAD